MESHSYHDQKGFGTLMKKKFYSFSFELSFHLIYFHLFPIVFTLCCLHLFQLFASECIFSLSVRSLQIGRTLFTCCYFAITFKWFYSFYINIFGMFFEKKKKNNNKSKSKRKTISNNSSIMYGNRTGKLISCV